jgi:hypothetical protein
VIIGLSFPVDRTIPARTLVAETARTDANDSNPMV